MARKVFLWTAPVAAISYIIEVAVQIGEDAGKIMIVNVGMIIFMIMTVVLMAYRLFR